MRSSNRLKTHVVAFLDFNPNGRLGCRSRTPARAGDELCEMPQQALVTTNGADMTLHINPRWPSIFPSQDQVIAAFAYFVC